MLGMAKPRKSSENHICPQRKSFRLNQLELLTKIVGSYSLSLNTAIIFLAAAFAGQTAFVTIDTFHIVMVIAAVVVSVLYTSFAKVTRITRLVLALSVVVIFILVPVLAYLQDTLSAQPHGPPPDGSAPPHTTVSGHAGPTMIVQDPRLFRTTEF